MSDTEDDKKIVYLVPKQDAGIEEQDKELKEILVKGREVLNSTLDLPHDGFVSIVFNGTEEPHFFTAGAISPLMLIGALEMMKMLMYQQMSEEEILD